MRAVMMLAGVVLATTACAPRAMPYRFRAPVLGGVAAAEPRGAAEPEQPNAGRVAAAHTLPTAHRLGVGVGAAGAADARHSSATARRPRIPVSAPYATATGAPRATASAARPRDARSLGSSPKVPIVTSRAATTTESDRTAPLAHVGVRTPLGAWPFARLLLTELGARVGGDLASLPDGSALLAALRPRLLSVDGAEVGDLLLFDGGDTIGVITGRGASGAIEFVYAQRKVVRRGWLHVVEPSRQRDEAGRVLNTFVRPYAASDRSAQRHLAGELFVGRLAAASLVR